jgi:hypothetical protein
MVKKFIVIRLFAIDIDAMHSRVKYRQDSELISVTNVRSNVILF